MKIFQKIKKDNGRRQIYLFGVKVLSYKKRKKLSRYDLIYAKRFDGLTEDEMRYCLEEQFKNTVAYPLNLDNPQTFNEKLQWLKLYYHRHPNPLMTKCADKVAVRDYIKEKIGEEYLIPCLGIWDNPDQIDFDKLPNQFVLKVNWGSGQNIIVKDKSKLDIDATKNQLAQWMKPEQNHYFHFFEPCYKNIQPKIIAEKYLNFTADLLDYKIICYNGVPQNLFVCSERCTDLKVTFFDLDWKRLPFIRKYPSSKKEIKCPQHFKEMLKISKILAKPFPFVRVDFFCLKDKLYIGELTFFPGAGHEKFDPVEWDKKLGDLLVLPKEETIPNESNKVSIPVNSGIKVSINGQNNRITVGKRKYRDDLNINIGTSDCPCNNCVVEIGDDFSCNGAGIRLLDDNTVVTIGNDCMFADKIQFWASDTHTIIDLKNKTIKNLGKLIQIGNHVWIGYGATILKNTIIPDNCVIGTNSVVGGKFEKTNCVIAGNPAKVVKENIDWDRKRPNQYMKED